METQPLLVTGTKLKVMITLDAELVTDCDGLTKDQICDLVLQSDNYAASIIVGRVNPDPDCREDHDSELLLKSLAVDVEVIAA